MLNKEREVTLSWEDLAEILRKSANMRTEEEICGVTLVKPKQVLLSLRPKTNGKRGETDVSNESVS